MPLHVLVAPDKFKGTLTAREAADAIARGWRRTRPGDMLELLPITDGGEGFGEIMARLIGAETQTVETTDAAHRPIRVEWWWEPASRIAIIESARVIGLAQLPPKKFHPFELDTLGLGRMLVAAAEKGAARCLVGLGGSATNDGGFGLARALGWQFLIKRDEIAQRWTELYGLSHLHAPEAPLRFEELVVAVDVRNPLLGPAGCTRVFGPQKGIGPEDFDFAERCLQELAKMIEKQLGRACASEPGAGAAGGLGFGLRCFAGARLEPGFSAFARQANLAASVRAAGVVVTGEGMIDDSTAMGKGVGELARLCQQFGVPCVGLAGRVGGADSAKLLFRQLHALTPEFASMEEAMGQPALWLERLAERAASRCDG